jgi:hypothetical protein
MKPSLRGWGSRDQAPTCSAAGAVERDGAKGFTLAIR